MSAIKPVMPETAVPTATAPPLGMHPTAVVATHPAEVSTWPTAPSGSYPPSVPAPPPQFSQPPTIQNVVNTNIVITQKKSGPNLLVRGIWFVCIGWWAGAMTMGLAYLLIALMVTIPAGFALLNRIPQVMTLRPRTASYKVDASDPFNLVVEESTLEQRPWIVRIPYFIFIGSWVGFLWMVLAWCVGVFTLGFGLPISFWMFDRVGAISTLYRT